MNPLELIALLVTGIGVLSFAVIFTVLYRSYANSAATEYESGVCDVELIEETIRANFRNTKLFRRVMRRVKQVLIGVLIAVLIPFLFLSVWSKVTNGVAMIRGYGVMAVASGSMSMKNEANPYLSTLDNQFDTYDMIVVRRVESTSELKKFDVIAFVNDEGTNVIHRIVDIRYTANGIRYVTRGDSNNADDKYMPAPSDVIGKYTDQKVPYVGVFALFLQSYSGILTIAAIIYCLLMIESMGNRIRTAYEERLELLLESIDFKSETVTDDGMHSIFLETVYFKNYAYIGLGSNCKQHLVCFFDRILVSFLTIR